MTKALPLKFVELVQRAKAIPRNDRIRILMSFGELDFHKHLKQLFEAMEPDSLVEVTHGSTEYGKDLVIVEKDNLGTNVFGVIVKMGSIKGTTAGDVDEVIERVEKAFSSGNEKRIKEIVSQVEQAFSHNAEIKTSFEKLPISKAFVVLAGELSRSARIRFENELQGRYVEYIDIEWLVDRFTTYYPQVFFESAIIDFVQKKIHELETGKQFSYKKINLSEYFIEPLVAPMDAPLDYDKELARILKRRRMQFSQFRSVLAKNKKIILVGDPGTGKSAALTKLAIDLLDKACSRMIRGTSEGSKINVPILVTAKELLAINDVEELHNIYFKDPEIIERFGAQLLMVDALDEVDGAQRPDVIEKATAISNDLNCALIITSRRIDLINMPQPAFEKYELLPFKFGQALHLCEKLASSKQTLDALTDGLERIKHQILMVPLSLILLIQLVEDQKEIPASLTELYDRYFDIALGRYDKDKGIEVLFEYSIKKLFLATLAYSEFFVKDRLEISKEEFNDFFNEYASEYGWDPSLFKGFIRELERACIIDVRETISFHHRSFLDYFTAFYIYESQDEIDDINSFIVKVYFDDIWTEVAFFYIGLRRRISKDIITKIFDYDISGLYGDIHKALAGKLMQAGWHSPTKTKQLGVSNSLGLFPSIREGFLETMVETGEDVPRLFGDMFVMTVSDIALSSVFLLDELRVIFNQLAEQPSKENLFAMLAIIWGIKRLISPDELRESIDKAADLIYGDALDLTPEEQARSLILIDIMEKQQQTIGHTVQRKLNRLKRRNPDTFKALLPRKRK